MKLREIINKNTGDVLSIVEDEDFEYVNPIKHYGDSFIVNQLILNGIPKKELFGKRPVSKKSKEIFIQISLRWKNMLLDFKKVDVHQNLIDLLLQTKKREQKKLLKEIVLTPKVFMAFLIRAFEDYGYTLSQYSAKFDQKGADLAKMPLAHNKDDNSKLVKFGKTDLSDGQLRQAIDHRKVRIAKFLDNGDKWHCFLITFRSLRGEETWLGEKQPHYHYISSSFGIERNSVIEQIKSEKYQLSKLPHIKLKDIGTQPKK